MSSNSDDRGELTDTKEPVQADMIEASEEAKEPDTAEDINKEPHDTVIDVVHSPKEATTIESVNTVVIAPMVTAENSNCMDKIEAPTCADKLTFDLSVEMPDARTIRFDSFPGNITIEQLHLFLVDNEPASIIHNDQPLKLISNLADIRKVDGARFHLKLDCDVKCLEGLHPYGTHKVHIGGHEVKASVFRSSPEADAKTIVGEDEHGVVVEWLPEKYKKAFLGGWRNKRNEKEYHNATAQTRPPPIPRKPTEVYRRETQTYQMRHTGSNTVNTTSTQSRRPGFHISSERDRLLKPGPYEDAATYHQRVITATIVLQKYFRRWKAARFVNHLKEQKRMVEAWREKQTRLLKEEREQRIAYDLQRRLHPKKRSDFDRIFNSLEEWRLEETARINREARCEAERKTLIALLVEKQAELIDTIGRRRTAVTTSNRQNVQHNLLKKAAASKAWYSSRTGRPLEMETKYTLRAKELLDIFETLCLDCLTQDERLDILLTLKQTVQEHDCALTREIRQLVDREAYFLMRGVPERNLAGLRSRIVNRFMAYCRQPTFNPEIANHLPVPTGTREGAKSVLRGDVVYCKSCSRYLRMTAFPLEASRGHVGICRTCTENENLAGARRDLQPYRLLLRDLRMNERKLEEARKDDREKVFRQKLVEHLEEYETLSQATSAATNAVANNPMVTEQEALQLDLVVNAEEIRQLVDGIWERKSVLSGWTNLVDLVLSRWRVHEPWSPWNCILLTKEEALLHSRSAATLPLESMYGDSLLYKVKQRHSMAQYRFNSLLRLGRLRYEQKQQLTSIEQPVSTELEGDALKQLLHEPHFQSDFAVLPQKT